MPAMRLPAASYETEDRQSTLSCKGCITGKSRRRHIRSPWTLFMMFSFFRSSGYAGFSKRLRGARMWRLCATAHSQQ